jgi:hypothetical protein
VTRSARGIDRLLGELVSRISKLPRTTKRFVMLTADAVAIPAAVLLAAWLTHPAGVFWPLWLWALPLLVCLPMFTASDPFAILATRATVPGRAGSGLRLAWGRARRHFRRKGEDSCA